MQNNVLVFVIQRLRGFSSIHGQAYRIRKISLAAGIAVREMPSIILILVVWPSHAVVVFLSRYFILVRTRIIWSLIFERGFWLCPIHFVLKEVPFPGSQGLSPYAAQFYLTCIILPHFLLLSASRKHTRVPRVGIGRTEQPCLATYYVATSSNWKMEFS